METAKNLFLNFAYALSARHIGMADRAGSLGASKVADIVTTGGSHFEASINVKTVFIDGKKVFEQA